MAAGCGPKTWVPRAAVGLSRGTCLLRTRAVASRGIWARHAGPGNIPEAIPWDSGSFSQSENWARRR